MVNWSKKYLPVTVACAAAVLNVLFAQHVLKPDPSVWGTVDAVLAALFGGAVHVNL